MGYHSRLGRAPLQSLSHDVPTVEARKLEHDPTPNQRKKGNVHVSTFWSLLYYTLGLPGIGVPMTHFGCSRNQASKYRLRIVIVGLLR